MDIRRGDVNRLIIVTTEAIAIWSAASPKYDYVPLENKNQPNDSEGILNLANARIRLNEFPQ